MPDQIYIGNFAKGLKNDRLPFNIDNDAFPFLYNFYAWRGRIKRKRGTSFLGQLERQIQSVLDVTPPASWQFGQIALVGGAVNLITAFSLESTSTIAPGSISFDVGGQTYTDLNEDGTLQGSGGGTGTINYATGDITITGGGVGPLVGTFSYYSGLPVLGLRDLSVTASSTQYPLLLAFDQTYAYQINQSVVSAPFFYDISYYKITNNPLVWSGQDYQQFWSANYSGAFWATNNKAGFHFLNINTITVGNPTTITTALPNPLITGDYVYFSELTGADASLLNGLTLPVTVINDTTFTVAIDTTGKVINNAGIFQLLTNSISGQDGIRWYDGDPTSGTGLPTGTNLGWVNFAPPLTAFTISIDNLTPRLYYLVGALAIVPFKDRLLFVSPWIQASTGTAIQLIDTVLWSWNGTPYYTVSGSTTIGGITTYTPTLVPANETANPTAYYVDQAGKGGYQSAGIAQPIFTVTPNEDVLLIGFGGNGRKTRFVYSGNDLQPFLFFTINSELPSSATFSSITLDRGAIDIGPYGVAMTDQQSSQRIDLDIPDEIFQIQNQNSGTMRINAVRDFFREWIYFSYPADDSSWKFPTRTFLFNYRDNTWSLLYENFTAHGRYRQQLSNTWASIGKKVGSWENWREPWNSGSSASLFAQIVAGNPQGYVLIKDENTGEGISGTITAIADNGGFAQITSTNHCVTNANTGTGDGDYLYFQNAIGLLQSTITNITLGNPTVITTVNTFTVGSNVTISGVTGTVELNGNTYQITDATAADITIDVDSTDFTAYSASGIVISAFNNLVGKVTKVIDADNFIVDIPTPIFGASDYLGLGNYTRLIQPLLQTKQFPFYWDQGRQVILGIQKYLLDYTQDGQVTLNIYLSQNPDDIWNSNLANPPPNSLLYSQILYTCPESTNIGLTPANTNLQMPTASQQFQIWHRVNTSMIGNSFQIGITLSDTQMRDFRLATDEIVLHGMHFTVRPGPHLA